MEITLPTLAAGIGIACSLIGLHFVLTRDLRERYADLEKRYLAAEQARETVMHENLDLIKDYLGSDRAYKELREENERLRRRLGDTDERR